MHYKYLYILILIICSAKTNFGQSDVSAQIKKINNAEHDTTKINLYLDLIQNLSINDPYEAINHTQKLELLAKKQQFKLHVIYYEFTNLFINCYKFKTATNYAFSLLRETKKLKGNEKFDFEGRAYERLARIYSITGNLDLAINYQKQAISSYKRIKNDNYFIIAYINLSNFYLNQNKIETALHYFQFLERNLIKENLNEYFPNVYNGIAACYQAQKKLDKAIIYFEKSKQAVLQFTPDDLSSLAITYNNIGNLQNENKQYGQAVVNLSEALALFKRLGDKQSKCDVYYNLAMTYTNLKRFEKSNEFMLKYLELKDAIFDQDTKQSIHDLSIKYESVKKEQQNKLLSKENEKKQLSIYFALAALSLVVLILFIIFRNNRQKSKINKQLEDKNKIIQEKSHLVEEQNKDITDSIRYAERIQGAILPPASKWENILTDSFVLYQPKDILSGDFYWICDTETHIIVAAADCTGHGVPGALISIVNFNLLNKAILEKGLRNTAQILDAVNIWLTESLNQNPESSQIKDGMDVSIVALEKGTNKIQFTGANNPLYHFSKNSFNEYKGNKFPVGAFEGETLSKFDFTEIEVKQNDMIYLFSDGFADQFGGEKGKKFKYKQLRDLFEHIKDLPAIEQKEKLHMTFTNWKGSLEQIDDVLIIGIRIN